MGLMLSSPPAAFLPYLSTPRGVSCPPFPFSWAGQEQGVEIPGGGGLWGRGGEGGGGSVCPASHRQRSRLQLARANHPVHLPGGPSLSGPKSPSLNRASHGTFPLGHRHTDGFQCQLEHAPAQLVEVKERAGTKEPFRHSALTSQAPGI